MLLTDRAAMVTGGAGRLGQAIVATLRREGARVAIADWKGVDKALASLHREDGPEIVGVTGSVIEPADVTRMAADAEAAVGPLDILVNCAGIFPNLPLLEMTVEEWDQVFAINVRGAMLTCQALARGWVERDVRGSIINISSGAATSPRVGGGHYNSSKAALNMLTQVLAIELGHHGIRVNAVAPGLVLDDVVDEEREDQHPYVNMMLRGTPLGRTGAPADIAETVAFLASDRSGWTNGAIVEITGGSHCGRTHVPLTRDLQ